MSFESMAWAWRQRGLSIYERVVLLALAQYSDRQHHTAFPRVSTLAADAEISVASVQRALARLEERELITRVPQYREDGSRAANIYRLHIGMPPTPPTATTYPSDSDHLPLPQRPPTPLTATTYPSDSESSNQSYNQSYNQSEKERRGHSLRERVPFSDADRAQLLTRFAAQLGGAERVQDAIEAALNHTARLRAINERLYVERWLRRDVERRGSYGQGNAEPGRRAGGVAAASGGGGHSRYEGLERAARALRVAAADERDP